MNLEQASAFLGSVEGDYLADRDPHRFRRGLQVLEKYADDLRINAVDDLIYVGGFRDSDNYEEADLAELNRLGFCLFRIEECFGYYT